MHDSTHPPRNKDGTLPFPHHCWGCRDGSIVEQVSNMQKSQGQSLAASPGRIRKESCLKPQIAAASQCWLYWEAVLSPRSPIKHHTIVEQESKPGSHESNHSSAYTDRIVTGHTMHSHQPFFSSFAGCASLSTGVLFWNPQWILKKSADTVINGKKTLKNHFNVSCTVVPECIDTDTILHSVIRWGNNRI